MNPQELTCLFPSPFPNPSRRLTGRGMRVFRRCLVTAIAFTCMPVVWIFAQSTETAKPRIGLALGGGGALGFAHIGVLRFLEERRIPVLSYAKTRRGPSRGVS
jgi:hypothetical protein